MSVAYLVIYEGQPEDRDAFLQYYVEKHLPLIWTWPHIRKVEVALSAPHEDALANPSAIFMIARFLFVSLADLNAALRSPQRQQARADSHNFPPFHGTMRHLAVEMIDVPET